MFRTRSKPSPDACDLSSYLSGAAIRVVRLEENAPAHGKSVAQIQLRKKCGVTLLAVQRSRRVIPTPDSHEKLLPGDALVLIGDSDRMAPAVRLFNSAGGEGEAG